MKKKKRIILGLICFSVILFIIFLIYINGTHAIYTKKSSWDYMYKSSKIYIDSSLIKEGASYAYNYYDGEDITFTPQHIRAKSIGRLYQDPMRGTAPGMTIEENLALAAGKGGWLSHTTKQEKERFREELKKLDIGLEERMSHPVGLLSGGQRQALTLLMATMCIPLKSLPCPKRDFGSVSECQSGVIRCSLKSMMLCLR